MFDKMKQLYDLQKKAREIQKKLEAIKIEESEGGVKVAINGTMKVESVEIDPSYLSPDKKQKLESLLGKLFSNAVEEVQKRSAMESKDLLKGMSF